MQILARFRVNTIEYYTYYESISRFSWTNDSLCLLSSVAGSSKLNKPYFAKCFIFYILLVTVLFKVSVLLDFEDWGPMRIYIYIYIYKCTWTGKLEKWHAHPVTKKFELELTFAVLHHSHIASIYAVFPFYMVLWIQCPAYSILLCCMWLPLDKPDK